MKRKMHAGASKDIYQRARELRNRSTHAEDILWGFLKTKPGTVKFRRQHPYSIFILDFYCHDLRLVIEVDGEIHKKDEIKERDQERENLLKADGLSVLRFTNEEVITKLEEVIASIQNFITGNSKK